jgi:hypothetical protein
MASTRSSRVSRSVEVLELADNRTRFSMFSIRQQSPLLLSSLQVSSTHPLLADARYHQARQGQPAKSDATHNASLDAVFGGRRRAAESSRHRSAETVEARVRECRRIRKQGFCLKWVQVKVSLTLAINMLGTFIHNEPTSLSVLQDQGLPQILYEVLSNSVPASYEVSDRTVCADNRSWQPSRTQSVQSA